MKNIVLVLFVACCCFNLYSNNFQIKEQNWDITFDAASKKSVIKYNGQVLLEGVYAEAKYNMPGSDIEFTLKSNEYDQVSFVEEPVNDNFGSGKQYIFTYSDTGDKPQLVQHFFFYSNHPYFLTELTLKSTSGKISSNYLAPLVTNVVSSFLVSSNSNRMLWVPWDNDGWVRFKSYKLDKKMTSHEVVAIFNGESRNGVVVGSVEHDTWKSGIYIDASNYNQINNFTCMSGYVSKEFTRDSIPHGKVTKELVKSAKFMVGCFDDWRAGMDEYGKANNLVVPRLTWSGGTPVGWSSWGSMQDKVSYEGAMDVASFLKNELFDSGFHDTEGKVVLSLDAFSGDNMSTYYLKQFATKCAANNQIAGTYYGPFCDWNGNPNRIVEGSDGKYKYQDIWLKVNGKVHRQGGICLDPTHPGTKMAMKYNIDRYKNWGYKYVKVDFLTNGGLEGDSYFNPEVTTGIQAYNEGMQYMLDQFDNDMYIVLAISPLFPYQYAHGRRTCCDSFSQLYETQYVMNSTSFGWWTNQLYQVNDPDHLVMISNTYNGTESQGVNRARITSGAVTGAFVFGDNFSNLVAKGYPEKSRERAKLLMTNKDINEMPRLCNTFRPVEGYKSDEQGAENLLMYYTDQYVYLACINYNTVIQALSGNMPFERIGIDKEDVASIKELWTGSDVAIGDDQFKYQVPPADARIYRITKKSGANAVDHVKTLPKGFSISQYADLLLVSSEQLLNCVRLYSINGLLLANQAGMSNHIEIDVSAIPNGIYLLKAGYDNGLTETGKVVIKK